MQRKLELDALRGLLLVLMTITHLPTRYSTYSSQVFGFVSAAEGFVFLSAFLTGAIYARRVAAGHHAAVRSSLLLRARRLYLWHLGLLLFAFTIVAAIGFYGQRPALYNLLSFYFEHPVAALWAGPLLLYQPPLLDILPMYVLFFIGTAFVMRATARWGWHWVLAGSVIIWVGAQFGLRAAVLMQTSGFGTIPNALASLVCPSQIPALIFVSERGTLGEFNLGQAMVCRTMRPVLDSLAMEHHTITRLDELEFVVDRSIKQAVAIQAPVAFILSPLLTGGKVFAK